MFAFLAAFLYFGMGLILVWLLFPFLRKLLAWAWAIFFWFVVAVVVWGLLRERLG